MRHERFAGWCGRLECKLKVLTPLCIKKWEERRPPARIQGATIKGMVRSAAEIISQSCFRIGSNPPSQFAACTNIAEACTCCRLFGGTFTERGQDSQGNSAFQSKVFFEDTFIPLSKLKKEIVHVSHQNCDYNWNGRRVFPHSKLQASGDTSFEVWTAPPGEIFKFGVDFECLDHDELGLLLYSLVLEPDMAHKMGYMKSRGLGSVRIAVTRLELIESYSELFMEYDSCAPSIEDTAQIESLVRGHIDQYLEHKSLNQSNHLQILRQLMKCEEE